MRKLASIQKIIDIAPIDGADKIEVATILGWRVVVKKGEFKVNDLVVFCEVDSLLPRTEWSEFLFKSAKDNVTRYRLKTVKLKKQISQGLILPTSIIPLSYSPSGEPYYSELNEGDDVTECLDIEKYEPYIPAQLQGHIKGNFPQWLPKTDEERVQNIPSVLERHAGKEFYITEKLNGSSMTVYVNAEGEFGVCSRNLDLKETEGNAYWKTARELDLETILRKGTSFPIALQGELIGQGIQKNPYKLEGLEFRVFNVSIDYKFLNMKEFIYFCETNGLKTVPILKESYMLADTVDSILELAKGKSVLNPKMNREGLVFRPVIEDTDDKLGRLSFKAINNDFLLENEE